MRKRKNTTSVTPSESGKNRRTIPLSSKSRKDSSPQDQPHSSQGSSSQKSKGKKTKKGSHGVPRIKLPYLSTGLPEYTLLETENRIELPPIDDPGPGRPGSLIHIVLYAPHVYARMIGFIRQGAAGHVAAEAIGVRQQTFYGWAKRGIQELAEEPPLDTFYTRFYNDVIRAVALCRGDCEIAIKLSNPKKWLSHGPGKVFGTNWQDEPKKLPPGNPPASSRITDQSDILEADFQILPTNQGNGSSAQGGQMVTVDQLKSIDTLAVLEEAGIIKVGQAYKDALKDQDDEIRE